MSYIVTTHVGKYVGVIVADDDAKSRLVEEVAEWLTEQGLPIYRTTNYVAASDLDFVPHRLSTVPVSHQTRSTFSQFLMREHDAVALFLRFGNHIKRQQLKAVAERMEQRQKTVDIDSVV